MSVALPNGFVSVPGFQNVGYNISADARIRDMAGCWATLNGWQLYGAIGPPSLVGEAWLSGPFAGSPQRLESVSIPFFGTPPYSAWYTFTEAGTGFRLGVRYRKFTGAVPAFGQRDWIEEYSWFADAGTQIVQSMAGYTYTQTFTDPPTEVGPIIGTLAFGLKTTSTAAGTPPINVQMQAMSVTDWPSGLITQLNDGVVRGTGAGQCEIYALGDRTNYCSGSYSFTYDCEIDQAGTPNANWARVIDTFLCAGPSGALPFITFPANNGSYSPPLVSWPVTQHVFSALGPGVSVGSYLQFLLDPAWMASQDPPLESADQYVGIRGPCGLDDPSGPTGYTPLKIKFLGSVELHRPDGNKPSSWVALDANGSVVDGATNVVFTVTGAGSRFRRTLNTNWRALADYRKTRHEPPFDVYWIAGFGWLKQTWNASVACGVTLEAKGVHYEVGVGEHAWDLSYGFSLAGGAEGKYVDLIAGSGAEAYPTRVDSWDLVFDTPGTYTLSAMSLVARTDLSDGSSGKVHLKTEPTKPVANTDYTMMVAALDGAQPLCCLPPLDSNKGNEITGESYGGAPRHIVVDMLQLIDAFLVSGIEYGLGNIEGIADPVYDPAAYSAKNRDTYGNSLNPENADWVMDYVPDQLIDVDTDWQPEVRPLCARLRITNHCGYKAYVRWNLWGTLEALVLSGAARAAAGTAAAIVRDDTGATVWSGTCDAQGQVFPSPVPANSALVLRGGP